MIDENLPTFYLKPSTDNIKYNTTIFLAQYGSDATPTYTLRHPDPASPESRNRYAAALYDSYFQEILFGEVLLIPEWTQPSPTQEQLRLAGGVPPAPQPIMPHEFAIQLYNPDQQVVVRHHPASWNSAQHWEFEMPMQTFRQPSTSTLDRTLSDPTASETTPKIGFKWRKEKLSKDLICNLSGKSANPDGSKRKNKEPDIPVAFFSHLKNVTIYEPNLSRVDMEDPKGLEVVLLLSAAVIKDVYFSNMKEAFNISETPRQRSGSGGQRKSPPILVNGAKVPTSQNLPSQNQHHQHGRHHHHDAGRPPLHVQTTNPRPPPTDPRSQWEIDLETHRLKKQVEYEEKARRKAEQAEMKRVKQMLEAEEKEARRKQADIDKETDRLRREYAAEQRRLEQRIPQPPQPPLPPRQNDSSRHSAPIVQQPYQRPPQQPHSNRYLPPGPDPQYLYVSRPGGQSGRRSAEPTLKPKRSSFFGFMTGNGDEGPKLHKKQSSIW